MKIKQTKPGHSLKALNDGIKAALSDDGRIGPNDAPALKKLARQAGLPELAKLVDRFKADYVAPPRHEHDKGSGYAMQVVSFKPGPGGGFNQNNLGVVLGRPEGAGPRAGSLHVVSLGKGGQMTLKLGRAVTHGLKVFENGFTNSARGGAAVDPELAKVEVSADGKRWFALKGTAGHETVEKNSANHIDVRSKAAGGDVFKFRDAGIPSGTKVQFVRVTDSGTNPAGAGGTAGFDLDAVWGF
jgi:hypothetical protein